MPEPLDAPATRPSLQARAFHLLLRLMRRRRHYASVPGLMAGIAATRRAGPAPVPARMRTRLQVHTRTVQGREVLTLAPADAAPEGPALLYLHGGGYCRPITSFHWSLIADLVQATGRTAVVPLYPLAPESDCLQALTWLRAVHAQAARRHGSGLPVLGDSAGAGLALALCQHLRTDALPLPDRLVLITPFMDVAVTSPQSAAIAPRDPMLGIAGVREAGRLWAGSLGVAHPLVSPLHAELRGLPAMQVFIAGNDILGPDALAFTQRALAAGCVVEQQVHARMVHAWPLLPVPEAQAARRQMAAFLLG